MKKLCYFVIIFILLYSCKKEEESKSIPHSTFNKKILDGYNVWSIAFDNSGNAWIGTYEQGLIKYNSNETVIYNSSNSILQDSLIIGDIAVDSKDNIWISTDEQGLLKYDGNSFTEYDSSNCPLPLEDVISIAIDSKDNIWYSAVGKGQGGVFMYDGTNWNIYTSDNSDLPDELVQSVAIDKDDNVWAALTKELVKISGNIITVYGENELGFSPYSIRDIKINSKNQVCGSISYMLSAIKYHEGPDVFIFDGILIDTLDYGSKYDTRNLMVDNLDNIWCSFSQGIYAIYNGKNWIDGYIEEHVITIEQAKDDKIWLGTSDGVYISD